MVGEAIEERAGEALGAEHLGPFVEGQIGGDQGRAPLVALAEHLEQQLGAGLRQRHEAEFVDDQKLVGGELLLEPQQLLVIAGLDEFVDQRGGGDEADREALLAGWTCPSLVESHCLGFRVGLEPTRTLIPQR